MLSKPTIISCKAWSPSSHQCLLCALHRNQNTHQIRSCSCFKTLQWLPTVRRVKSKCVAMTQDPAGLILRPSLASYQTILTMLQPHWGLSISPTWQFLLTSQLSTYLPLVCNVLYAGLLILQVLAKCHHLRKVFFAYLMSQVSYSSSSQLYLYLCYPIFF